MPPPRKVDLLPEELRVWLNAALREHGFAGYEDIAAALNAQLSDAGLELRIQKSALHAYGQDYKALVEAHREAHAFAKEWLDSSGVENEAKMHEALVQQLTTLCYKLMVKSATEGDYDARDLQNIGRTLKDVMQSSVSRENLLIADRKAALARVEAVTLRRGLSAETVADISQAVLGIDP